MITTAIIPNLIGFIDESAERALPPKLVKLAAKSKIVPAAQDLFAIRGVSGAGNSVKLHTQGLCRFGLTEIEILDSDSEHFNDHYNFLNAYGSYLLDMNEDFDPHKDVLAKFLSATISTKTIPFIFSAPKKPNE